MNDPYAAFGRPVDAAPRQQARRQPRPSMPQIRFADDRDAIIRTVLGEAGSEPEVGRQAVAAVIQNRARTRGLTPAQVVLERNQFEPWGNPETASRLMSYTPDSPEYQEVARQIDAVLQGYDPTGGASHFYSPSAQAALGRPAPSWDDGSGFEIGRHRFFRLEGQPEAQQADPFAAYGRPVEDAPEQSVAPAADPTVKVWNDLTPEQQMAIQPGDRVQLPDGEVVTAAGSPYANPDAAKTGESAGGNLYTEVPGLATDLEAISTAYIEQVPFLDEAVTAARAARDGISYSEARDQYRRAQDSLNQTNRGERVAGGLLGFGATLAVPMGGAGFVGKGASRLDRAARAGLLGSGAGAVYGAGAEDGGLRERAGGAATGGLLGYAGGVAGQEVVQALPRIQSGLSEAGARVARGFGIEPKPAPITPRATESAQDYVQRLIEESGADLSAAPSGKPITAAEAIGPRGVSQVAALTRRAGRTADIAQSQLGARAQEQGSRVVQDFADLTGMDPSGSADMIANLAATGRQKAAPLYDAAYARPGAVRSPLTDELLQRPSTRGAMNRAARIAAEEGRDPSTLGFDFNEAGDVIHVRDPSMQTLDYVKRGLDDVINTYRDKTTGRLVLDEEGRAIVRTATAFRDELVRLNPAYGEALQAGGDPLRLEDAFRQANRLFGVGVPERTFNTAIERMGPAERNALVAGFADKLFRDLQAGKLTTRQLNQINVPVTRAKLSALIGQDGANEFMSRIAAEIDMARTGGRMAPGTNSITSEVLEAMREQDHGVGLMADLSRNIEQSGVIGGAMRTGAQALAAPVAGFIRGAQSPAPLPVRDEIGRLLLSSPEEVRGLLSARRPRPVPRSSTRAAYAGGLLAPRPMAGNDR